MKTGAAPPRWHRLEFLDSRRESPTAATFRFSTTGTDLRYRPNQFFALRLDVVDPWGPVRRFSLSSSPTEEGILAITTKLTGSAFKDHLLKMRPGDVAHALGPFGHFILVENRPAVMIAGGIGITPLRGMIRYASDKGLDRPIRLLFSAREPEELVFRDEFSEIARRWENFETTYTITRPNETKTSWSGRTGRIDANLIRAAASDLDRPVYYACGTPEMVNHMIGLLLHEVNVPRQDVLVEAFMGY